MTLCKTTDRSPALPSGVFLRASACQLWLWLLGSSDLPLTLAIEGATVRQHGEEVTLTLPGRRELI